MAANKPDYNRKYYLKNKEQIKLARAEYNKRPEVREANRLRQARYRKAQPEKFAEIARANTRRRLGVVDAHGKTKDGPCEICESVLPSLHFDHDHTTGVFRGWLCGPCNRALGLMKDNPTLLERAAEYLRKRKNEPWV